MFHQHIFVQQKIPNFLYNLKLFSQVQHENMAFYYIFHTKPSDNCFCLKLLVKLIKYSFNFSIIALTGFYH